jgi:hypothetical protein
MPVCKNDNKRSYTGDEPSPKGLGYCAHAEKEGKIMKGKDGLNWIKSGNRWIRVKEYKLDKIKELLYNKMFSWFEKISSEGFFLINKNDECKFYKGKNIKTVLESDEIKMMIWTSQSSDSLVFFINYILEKEDNETIEDLLKSRNTLLNILDNKVKYLRKAVLYTDKDYTLKYKEKINDELIIKKLKKSDKLEKLLK